MKLKNNTDGAANEAAFSILDEFDRILEEETHAPFEFTNRGRKLTLHIAPATYADKIGLQYARQQGLFASMNIKELMQASADGHELDVAADAMKGMNFQVESAAETSFAYSLIARNVREFAELTQEQLYSKQARTREQFAERFLDAAATEALYNAIMGLGKKRMDRQADKVLDVAAAVKN